MKEMNKIPPIYKVAIIEEVNDDGRVKVKILPENVFIDDWIIVSETIYGENKDGWHGQLSIGDYVIISFLDYPYNQIPFVLMKIRNENNQLSRENSFIFQAKNNQIHFKNNGIHIDLAGDKFAVQNNTAELIKELSNLIDVLINALVITGIGAQPFTADTIIKLQNVKNKIDTFVE